jgi:hypothetical protein
VDFRLRLGAGFHVYWTPLLTCLGAGCSSLCMAAFQLFVLGSVFHYPGHAALITQIPIFGFAEASSRVRETRALTEPEGFGETRVERTRPKLKLRSLELRSIFSTFFFPTEGENCVRHRVTARFQRQSARPIARKRRYTRHLLLLPRGLELYKIEEEVIRERAVREI